MLEFLSTCLPAGYRSKHMISRPIVELAADGTTATARTDVVWIAANFENTIVGRYDDELVRDADGWRFRRRVETAGAPPAGSAADVGRRQRVSSATMRRDTPTSDRMTTRTQEPR